MGLLYSCGRSVHRFAYFPIPIRGELGGTNVFRNHDPPMTREVEALPVRMELPAPLALRARDSGSHLPGIAGPREARISRRQRAGWDRLSPARSHGEALPRLKRALVRG